MTADPGRSGGEGTGHPAGCQCRGMYGWGCAQDRETRLVVDPVTARDTIARALGEHRTTHVPEGGHARCTCGWEGPFTIAIGRDVSTHLADAAVAALASQERGEEVGHVS